MTDGFTIHVVPDEGCPRCGVNGSPKVTDADGTCWWKCLGAGCTMGYWVPGTDRVEERLSPDEAKASAARITAEVDEMMRGKTWELDPNSPPGIETYRLVPEKEE